MKAGIRAAWHPWIRLETARSRQAALGLSVLIAAVLAVLFYSSTWRTGDDGRYYVLGVALADGAGLVQYDNPLQPPVTLTPPVYPAVISAIIRMVPNPVVWVKRTGSILYVAIALVGALMLAGPERTSRAGWLGACMGISAVGVAAFATYVMADMLFILLTFLCLWASRESNGRRLAPFLIGCGCGLAYLTRNAALTLAPAILLAMLIRRDWRRALWVGLGVAVVLAPWFYRRVVVLQAPDPYMSFIEIHASTHHGKSFSEHFLWMMAVEIVRDVPVFLFRVIPANFFYSASKVVGSDSFWRGMMALVGAGSLAGGLLRIRRWNEVDWFFIFTLLLLAAIPGPVYDQSYFYPLLPIAAYYFFYFMFWMARRASLVFRRPGPGGGIRAVALGIFAISLSLDFAAGLVHFVKEAPRRPHPPWAAERFLAFGIEYYDAWARVSDAAAWVQTHTPTNALLMSRKPDHLFVMSGRQGWRYEIPREVGAETIMGAVERFAPDRTVLLLEDTFPIVAGTWAYGNNREAVMNSTVRKYPDRWQLLHATEAPVTRVWGYHAEDAGGDATPMGPADD